jgi:hypothetical protein
MTLAWIGGLTLVVGAALALSAVIDTLRTRPDES